MCIQCGGGVLEPREVTLQGEVKGTVVVVRMPGLACPQCGYQTVRGPQMPEFMRLAAEAHREAHGLTSAEL